MVSTVGSSTQRFSGPEPFPLKQILTRENAMLVSVIIPVYNGAAYLADAVESVFEQTYPELECLIVDDGSTDNTNQILQSLVAQYPSLKVVRKCNGGPSSARNLGLRLCSGELVAFLDADDVLLPDKIERQVSFLREHPDIGMVYGDYIVVDSDLHAKAFFTARMPRNMHPLDALAYRNWFNPLVVLLRKAVIDRVGEFDEELTMAEDWDYWIRCAKLVPIAHQPGAVGLYRQHTAQVHRNYLRMREACVRVASKQFHDHAIRLRTALAAIDLKDAKQYRRERRIPESLIALVRYVFRHGLGLRAGSICHQFAAIALSQLRPLPYSFKERSS